MDCRADAAAARAGDPFVPGTSFRRREPAAVPPRQNSAFAMPRTSSLNDQGRIGVGKGRPRPNSQQLRSFVMMKSRLCSAFAGVVLTLALTTSVSAQQPARTAVQPYTVGQATPPLDPGKTLTPMTLEQALSLALEQNLDIQAAR